MPHRPGHSAPSWGRGGRDFWPAFAGGVVGGVAGSVLRPAVPVVVPPRPYVAMPPPPVVMVSPVWVEPVYELRPAYDVYGNVVRYDWVLVRQGYWR